MLILKKKIEEEKHDIVHERNKRKSLLALFNFKRRLFKFVFISKRKGNNDLIPRKHAYNMRLGSLPSWRPSAELYSKTFLFPVLFLKGGSVSSAFISRILTWSVLRGLAGKISVDSTSQSDRQWRLEWLHWNFSKKAQGTAGARILVRRLPVLSSPRKNTLPKAENPTVSLITYFQIIVHFRGSY